MSHWIAVKSVFAMSALFMFAACGGGGSATPDGGAPGDGAVGDAARDAGPAWPVPSDFPPDGPTQPGEGDACRLSVQCTDRRQICVNNVCTREERVRVQDLTLGEWRTLTPDSTDENPFTGLTDVSPYTGAMLDENGEIAITGYAYGTGGRTVLFRVGQDVRLVAAADADSGWLQLPFRDGFITFDRNGLAAFVGPDGVRQWTAQIQGAGPPPYDGPGVVGFVRPLVHTPSGPVAATVLSADSVDRRFDIVGLQRLDVEARQFSYVDFVDGPYVTGASIGQTIMGPGGLELILGRAEGDAQPVLSAYSVATGEERPIGAGPLAWGIAVTPVSSNDWVAVLGRDGIVDGCSIVAFGSAGDELARLPFPRPTECDFNAVLRPNDIEWAQAQYLRNASRRAWFGYDTSVTGIAESVDGVTWEAIGLGDVSLYGAASRYKKTWEVLGANYGVATTPGVYFAERSLSTSVGGGL